MPPRPLPPRPVPAVPQSGEQRNTPANLSDPFASPASPHSSVQTTDRQQSYVSTQLLNTFSPTELPLKSLRLQDDHASDGMLSWSFDAASSRSSSVAPLNVLGAAPGSAATLDAQTAHAHATASHASLVHNPSDDEQITYQYALRYAMLLDAENAQLAARTRSVGGLDALMEAASGQAGPLGSGGNATGGFAVRTVGKASGAPNLNNRTPTLVVSSRNAGADAAEQDSGSGKGRGWRRSLFGFTDTAARRLKAEVGSTGKLKQLAKGKSNPGGGYSSQLPAKDGGMTSNIIKALVQQLKRSSGASSLHPITKDCYLEMYSYLRVKEHGETLAEHGTIGDIMDMFADMCSTVCKRHGITSSEAISRTVGSQMEGFVKLFRSMLQTKAQVSREAGLVLLKLDDYQELPFAGHRMRSKSELPVNVATPQQRASLLVDIVATEEKLVSSWLKRAFHVPDPEHRHLVAELRHEVNQETATYDLRMCLLLLKKDQSFAGRPSDFRTPHAYNIWKEREITSLEQLIHSYAMRQSYMSGEQIGARRLKMEASAAESMRDEDIAAAFEYIPAKATQHYRMLVHKAVTHDIVNSQASANSISVLQLSSFAKDLLKQLSIAWRISASYRETCYLDVINEYYEQDLLSWAYLLDAFGKVERIIHLMSPMEWLVPQYQYLLDVESRIEYRALGCTQDAIEELDQQRPETSDQLKRILRALVINDASSPVVTKKPMPNVPGRRQEVMAALEPSIVYRCECLTRQCFGDEAFISSSLDGYAQLAALVLRDYEWCLLLFSMPLLEDGDRRYDIAGIVAEIETEHLYANLKRHIDQFGYSAEGSDTEATLELCRLVSKIEELHSRYSAAPLTGIDTRRLFKETVAIWLRGIDREKAKWAENALKQDSSPRELDIGKHSTSPTGHLLLQVTMDGERDDVEFYSGRMFRFLERTMSDMQQRIVEQVSTGIHDYLRQILVAQPARYRASRILNSSYVGIDRGIERSIQFLKRGGHQAPATIRVTQESCCEALIPLIDYLEDSLHTLFVHLYDDTANGVIVKVWGEALLTLEDILLPPLHGTSKGSAKALTEADMQNIFDCLDFLKWYFGGGADKDGISEDVLVNRKYQELHMVREIYFMTSKELMDAYMQELRQSATQPSEETFGVTPVSLQSIALSPGLRKAQPVAPHGRSDSIALQTLLSPALAPTLPSRDTAASSGSPTAKRPVPPPPIRTRISSADRQSVHRFGEHEDGSLNSSTDTLPMPVQDIRTAI
ncbi:hypothetical protein GGI02_003251, partial [Coemansia sp. RSA 2322]